MSARLTYIYSTVVCPLALAAILTSMSMAQQPQAAGQAKGPQIAPAGTGLAEPKAATSTSPLANPFLAQTKIQLLNQTTTGNDHSYHFSLIFPTNTTGDLVVTVKLNQFYGPTPKDLQTAGGQPKIYNLTVTQATDSSDPSKRSATLNYFVPYSSFPPDAVRQLHSLSTSASSSRVSLLANVRYVSSDGMDNQEGEGAGTNSQGEEGADVSEVLEWIEKGLNALDSWLESNGQESPVPEPLGAALSAGLGINAALNLSEVDADLLAQALAYGDCAHNQSLFGNPNLQNFDGAQTQNFADSTIAEIQSSLLGPFLAQLGLTGSSLAGPEAPLILAYPASWMSNLSDQQVQEFLQQLRTALPNCVGTWYGTYQITTTLPIPSAQNPAENTTTSDMGVIHFAGEIGNNVKGTISGSGSYKYVSSVGLARTGGFSYKGTIYGTVQQGLRDANQPASAASGNGIAVMDTGPVSPDSFTVTDQYPPNFRVLFPDPSLSPPTSQTPTPTYHSVRINLIDGQTTSDDYLPLGHDPTARYGPYASLIPTGHYTITIHKLK